MFKINEFLAEEIGEPPIVLLDDISSELDKDNISLLFQGKINPNQQAIITTTHLEQIPEESADKSQIILLDDISE
jgi:recombinational DNA repair ATPase RecF